MNPAAVWKVINDRLAADATLVALLGIATSEGIYNNMITSGATMPYIVYDVGVFSEEGGYKVEGIYMQFRVSVYDVRTRGLDRVNTLLTRIYGDSQAQSWGQPSFGLHRWSPTLAGSWVAAKVARIDSTQAHEEDVWHFIETFDFRMSLT